MKNELSLPMTKDSFGSRFWTLWFGQTVSQLGSMATGIALVAWMQDLGAGSGLIGGYFAFASVVMVLTGLFAGPIGDRFERRSVILCADLIAMIATFLTALMVNHINTLFLAAIIAFGLRAVIVFCFALRAPSMTAEISTSVSSTQIRSAFSFSASSRQIVGFIGEATGGTVYAAFGKMTVFLVDALTYLIASISTFSLPPRNEPSPTDLEQKKKNIARELLNDLKEGFNFVLNEPFIRPLFVLLLFLNLVFSPIIVWIPFVVRGTFAGGVNNVGYSLAAVSMGMLLGSIVSGLKRFDDRNLVLFISSLFLMATGFTGVFFVDNAIALLGPIFLIGCGAGIVNIVVPAHIQSLSPHSLQSRMASLVMFSGQIFNPVAQGIFGAVGEVLDKKIVLIPLFSGLLVFVLLAVSIVSQSVRRSFNRAA